MNTRNGFSTGCGVAAVLLALLLSSFRASAALDDMVLTFSTPGIDRYADGRRVIDGECYALVWSPAGKAFSGFNADGTAASPQDCVVLAAPLAVDGRCPPSLFQIPAEEYAALEDGTWAVCLVDTRRANGAPAGVKDGRPARVNRWVAIEDGVRVTEASELSLPAPAALTSGARGATSGGGARATKVSKVPVDTPSPVIAAMEVADDIVTLSVADTVPYLSYTIESGRRLGSFAIDGYADKVDGDDASEIVLETDAVGTTRFFRIIRAE